MRGWYKVPVRDVVGVTSRGCRKLQSGNVVRVVLCESVRFAACWDCLLLLLGCLCAARVLLKGSGSVGCNRPDRVQDGAQTHAQTRAHTKTPFVDATKGVRWKCGCCCAMVVITCEELRGRGDTYRYTAAAADSAA